MALERPKLHVKNFIGVIKFHITKYCFHSDPFLPRFHPLKLSNLKNNKLPFPISCDIPLNSLILLAPFFLFTSFLDLPLDSSQNGG